MATPRIRTDEIFGLTLAVMAHAGLVALLVLRPPTPPMLPPPERMTVTLSQDVGLTSTSPEPAAKAAPDVAPVIGEPPAEQAPPEQATPEPAPEPVVKPKPAPRVEPVPPPKPKPVARSVPVVQPRPVPRPVQRVVPTPQAKPASKVTPAARPAPSPATRPALTLPPRRQAAPAGGSRLGNDFLKGLPGAQATGVARNPPAAAIGPAVQSALSGAISRQLKPRWVAPQGVDAEKLVTILSWTLNADGTLSGRPTVVRQEGINDANRPQAARHAEQAIRAVQLAAPLTLPPEYYDAWKRVSSFRFDRRLSQ